MTAGVALGVAMALLVAITGYLAAVETVVVRTDVVRAMRLHEEDAPGSAALLWLTEHRGSTLNALLVATVTVRVALAAVAAIVGWELVGDGAFGAVVAAVIVIAVSVTGAEVAPRTLVLRSLEAAAGRLAPSARGVVRVVDPFARVGVAVGRALVPRLGGVSGPYVTDEAPDENGQDVPDEELEPEERAMIRSVLSLGETRVREVMVPRPDLVTVAEDASFDDLVAVVTEHGVSRIPVHDRNDPDAIIGIVYAKDLLPRVATDRRRRWNDLVRRPTFVPETKRCDELLRELQEATVHLALVIDEYGDLVGLVTIEDILEEIVGEIIDEHDHEEPLVEPLDDGWRVDARLAVDDLNELLGADLPEEGWDTVGGLVFGTLGRVPVEGERVELGGVCLTVERVQGRRVAKVLARASEPRDDDEDGAARDGHPESDRH